MSETFDHLYHCWLNARAALADPNGNGSDEATKAHTTALDEAERALLAKPPARSPGKVWKKFELLESAPRDRSRRQSVHLVLASIRTDLMTHGHGDGWE
jgi:hypothetical protein